MLLDFDLLNSPGDQIYLFQIADAELVDPKTFAQAPPGIPRLLPWSRSHRLYPMEGYLPVVDCVAAVLATGYRGPLSLEARQLVY